MSDKLNELFLKCSKDVMNLKEKPDQDELLIIYGLYKQSTCGNCNITCPNFYNFTEKKKYDAWNNLKDVDMDDAKKKYIREVKLLIMKYELTN